MSPAGLLISCVSSPSANGRGLEGWLAATIARFGPEQAVLYRALEEGAVDRDRDQPDQAPARSEKLWFLSISGHAAADSPGMAELLTEMRVLGLNPTAFHPGPLPMAHQGLANVF
jgi:hypothetical protein